MALSPCQAREGLWMGTKFSSMCSEAQWKFRYIASKYRVLGISAGM